MINNQMLLDSAPNQNKKREEILTASGLDRPPVLSLGCRCVSVVVTYRKMEPCPLVLLLSCHVTDRTDLSPMQIEHSHNVLVQAPNRNCRLQIKLSPRFPAAVCPSPSWITPEHPELQLLQAFTLPEPTAAGPFCWIQPLRSVELYL